MEGAESGHPRSPDLRNDTGTAISPISGQQNKATHTPSPLGFDSQLDVFSTPEPSQPWLHRACLNPGFRVSRVVKNGVTVFCRIPKLLPPRAPVTVDPLTFLSCRYFFKVGSKELDWNWYRDLDRLFGESWWTKKWGAIRGKKLQENREIVVGWTVGVVGAYGQFTQGTILRNPRTKYKRSKNIFTVTLIELIIGCDWYQLLQPLAQSLIGSLSTLLPAKNGLIPLWSATNHWYVVKCVAQKRNQSSNNNEWYNVLVNFIFKFSLCLY